MWMRDDVQMRVLLEMPYYVNRSLGSAPVAPGNKERLLKLDAKVV